MINNYYQKLKEKLQKEARERYQNLSKKKKKKREKRSRNAIRIFLKNKSRS